MNERDDYKLLKARLHRKLLDSLDLEQLGQTPNATAQELVLLRIRNLIATEDAPLSAVEKEQLARRDSGRDLRLGSARTPNERSRGLRHLGEWL
jgi:hypothetical protein